MAQVIRIKRRIGSAGAPTAAQVSAGELAYNRTAAAGAGEGPDDLYVGDGTAVHPLVSASRQVELTGAQSITGLKTFAVGGATPSLAVTGGGAGNVLTTNGSGTLSWAATPPATVLVEDPITGTGASGFELTVTPADTTQIATGTDDVFPVTSLGLRDQLGAAATATNLGTTATTVVPAIHELAVKLTALIGPLQLVGTYSAASNTIVTAVPPAPGTLVGQPLPAAAAANQGWFFILTAAGTGVAPAPTVPMVAGDWVLSTGAAWIWVDIVQATIAAANVHVTAVDSTGWTNVQDALQGLFDTKLEAVEVDNVSITGTGVTGDELTVELVDGGTYT